MPTVALTPNQQRAVNATGNVLVMAGAGTGKTGTLVERCVRWIAQEGNSLRQVLMVTFTEAAAAEMRRRIRQGLSDLQAAAPANRHLAEQVALLEMAHIGTLHSFCLHLLREHFHLLNLDPNIQVIDQKEALLLAHEVLRMILETWHETPGDAEAIERVIQKYAGKRDQEITRLILRLHHYSQTLPDPVGWLEEQTVRHRSAAPDAWRGWLLEAIQAWRDESIPELKIRYDNFVVGECCRALEKLPANPSKEDLIGLFRHVAEQDKKWGHGEKGKIRVGVEAFFDEADFFSCYFDNADTEALPDSPLEQDWEWCRHDMLVLLRITKDFGAAFSEAKRERGGVDFHDLEQLALRLLWDAPAGKPTSLATLWRKRFERIFVDEYQDINAAQDGILRALGREDATGNRFLVGDVKQSIYRFRLAAPHIFQGYAAAWQESAQVIWISENFRSHPGILRFVNTFFSSVMKREIGGGAYEAEAFLEPGAADPGQSEIRSAHRSPVVELHLLLKEKETINSTDGTASEEVRKGPDVADLPGAEKEAMVVGLRLLELKKREQRIWDGEEQRIRPADWKDMVILLRSPGPKAETYAKVFARLNLPLLAPRGGFFESSEIMDLLAVLSILDNPQQDVPLLAVLRSPFAGFSVEDLARIRSYQPQGGFWRALTEFHRQPPDTAPAGTTEKTTQFFRRLARWRTVARGASVAHLIERIIDESSYLGWIASGLYASQALANLQRLQSWAEEFEKYDQQSLFRFLKLIEIQQEAELPEDPAPVAVENAIRLMSVHQSKGLEFPIVVVADCGKDFNVADLRKSIILDDHYQLAPMVVPERTGTAYPSVPWWLARRRQRRELWGEEMRLLYVAMTRARDLLILAGSERLTALARWAESAPIHTHAQILDGTSWLDWLGPWLRQPAGAPLSEETSFGTNGDFSWRIYTKDDFPTSDAAGTLGEPDKSETLAALDSTVWREMENRLAWEYPHRAATTEPAKATVTSLRKRAAADEEAAQPFASKARFRNQPEVARTAEIGSLHHAFLAQVSLDRCGSENELRQEAERLARDGALSEGALGWLDLPALAAFWQSSPGCQILTRKGSVVRELPFTARFTGSELNILGIEVDAGLGTDFVVVQGAADLVVLLPDEFWLLDFKTDRFELTELPAKLGLYAPQLRLYAAALEKIYRRPASIRWLHFLAMRETHPV